MANQTDARLIDWPKRFTRGFYISQLYRAISIVRMNQSNNFSPIQSTQCNGWENRHYFYLLANSNQLVSVYEIQSPLHWFFIVIASGAIASHSCGLLGPALRSTSSFWRHNSWWKAQREKRTRTCKWGKGDAQKTDLLLSLHIVYIRTWINRHTYNTHRLFLYNASNFWKLDTRSIYSCMRKLKTVAKPGFCAVHNRYCFALILCIVLTLFKLNFVDVVLWFVQT